MPPRFPDVPSSSVVKTSTKEYSPILVFLIVTTGVALLACLIGSVVFYAFSLAQDKEILKIIESERKRNQGRARNKRSSTSDVKSQSTDSNKDKNKETLANDAAAESQGRNINERISKRLRQQFLRPLLPNQWNLPAILELAEAANCIDAGDGKDKKESSKAMKTKVDSDGHSLKGRQVRANRNCHNSASNLSPLTRLVGVTKGTMRRHPHGQSRLRLKYNQQQHYQHSSFRRPCQRNPPTLKPSQIAVALGSSQIRQISQSPLTSTPTPSKALTPRCLRPASPPKDTPEHGSTEERPNCLAINNSSREDRPHQLKLMLRLSQDLGDSSSRSNSSSCCSISDSINTSKVKGKPQKNLETGRQYLPDSASPIAYQMPSGSRRGDSNNRIKEYGYAYADIDSKVEHSLSTASGLHSSSTDTSS